MIKKWGLLLGLVAVAAIGLGLWGFQQVQDKRLLQVALGNNYQRAFYNSAYHVQNIEVLLGKTLVSAEPSQHEDLFEQIWSESSEAMDNLTQLPVGDAQLGRTVKFIAQLGDYSKMLSEQVSRGVPVTTDQWDTLNGLYNQASSLNLELGKIHANVMDGRFNFAELALAGTHGLAREGRKLASANFQDMDKQMYGYPTLIYDGPFSDHLERVSPRELSGGAVSEARARSLAVRYYDAGNKDNIIAQVTGSVEGNIPAYRVETVRRKGGEVVGQPMVADISKKGGHLVWFINPREVPSADWSAERAAAKAQQYLNEHGYKNMKQSYYQRNDNTITVNFAQMQNGVVIYPDLVKVTVALDNGQVLAMDARGYLMSHHNRTLPKPKITEEQARGMISGNLQVKEKGRLALIPLQVDKERLTWEFKGTLGEETYLVYINALTGQEEKILRLIESDNGTLTM